MAVRVALRRLRSTVAGAWVRDAIYAAVLMGINVNLQLKAQAFGLVTFLTPGEIEKIRARQNRGTPGGDSTAPGQY
jgi:hypothetical protein